MFKSLFATAMASLGIGPPIEPVRTITPEVFQVLREPPKSPHNTGVFRRLANWMQRKFTPAQPGARYASQKDAYRALVRMRRYNVSPNNRMGGIDLWPRHIPANAMLAREQFKGWGVVA